MNKPSTDSMLTVAGGGAVVAGAWLPWMSYFAGLVPLRGIIGLNGRMLFGAGVIAIGLGAWMAMTSGADSLRRLRLASAALGMAIVGAAVWLLIGVHDLSHPQPTPVMNSMHAMHSMQGMLAMRLGPGLLAVLAGGAILTLTGAGRITRARLSFALAIPERRVTQSGATRPCTPRASGSPS
jgi:hypothetical protein